MMKESKKSITEAVERLWFMSLESERGSTIRWETIEVAARMERYTQSWGTVVAKWRRRLLREREIATLAEVQVGIRLLTKEQTVHEIPALRQRRMRRQASRAIRELRSVDGDGLSVRDRLMLTVQTRHLEKERLQLSRSLRDCDPKAHVSDASPKRPVKLS